MRTLKIILTSAAVTISSSAFFASAEMIELENGLMMSVQGGIVPNTGDYESWYGCAPTSAGMMLGYYDRNGYNGKRYDNFLVGAVAEESTFGNSDALVNRIIASEEHIAEYYVDEAGAGGDDYSWGDGIAGWHAPNCLADFMGTSQDAVSNTNGETWFYYYGDGSKLTASELAGSDYEDYDGMFGIGEYVEYCGYDVVDLYTQLTDNMAVEGFSFDDYKREIDNGRVVMIQFEGQSLFGYGYEENSIILHDTRIEGDHSMEWGGRYSGMEHWGVTCLTIDGGTPVPEPSIVPLMILGLGALGLIRRKKSGSR